MNDYYPQGLPIAEEYNPDRYGGYYGHYEGEFYIDRYVDGNPYEIKITRISSFFFIIIQPNKIIYKVDK